MTRGAGFHADQTGLKLAEKRHHLATTQRSADNNFSRIINGVYLKNVLGQIKPYGANPDYSRRGVKKLVSVD